MKKKRLCAETREHGQVQGAQVLQKRKFRGRDSDALVPLRPPWGQAPGPPSKLRTGPPIAAYVCTNFCLGLEDPCVYVGTILFRSRSTA